MWVTTNYKGERQVWYSENVIQEIKNICAEEACKHITYPDGRGGMTLEYTGAVDFAAKIIEIINKEEK
jgi:hypothetical protein